MSRCLLEYFGHCAFRWTTPDGARVVIDPFDNDGSRPRVRWFTEPMPEVRSDYVLVTHDHFDHRATHRVLGATIVREPCDISSRDLHVRGVADQHVPGHGPPGMRNVIFVVEAGGVRCCHWGDNRADPPQQIVEQLGRVDILMLAVDDSCHLLGYEDVAAIVDRLSPRVIVPMHYAHPSVSVAQSPLRGIDQWLSGRPEAQRATERRIELNPELLPAERQVWVFEPSTASV